MARKPSQKEASPPAVVVEQEGKASPVTRIKPEELKMLGQTLSKNFEQYRSDRRIAELKWLRNLRQYLGIYDPEIERELSANRSKAYPKITRVKVISVLSRIMNLMFPGNERNWEIKASPSADMSIDDVKAAMQTMKQKNEAAGITTPMSTADVLAAVQNLAEERAKGLSVLIDDQLQELGGDQTLDYVALNRKVAQSGILYGLGVLRGPYARETKSTSWDLDAEGNPVPKTVTAYKPMYEFMPLWDFYPDMSAKTLTSMDGYFNRLVMTRAQVRALCERADFFGDMIKKYLKKTPSGNYKAQAFETELKGMGVKINVNDQKVENGKYEIIVWNGPISAKELVAAGVEIAEDKMADDIDAEVWLIDGEVIKADINPWRKIGADVKTIHTFIFDEDDTSVVGNGLPNVMRDSQMSISAATRMLLDNASVTCGPNMELNTDLLRPDQDLTSVAAYKFWYREGSDQSAQFPAIRNIQIDNHIQELLKTIELFMGFADTETFVGPATGGDMAKGPSEPMRTAAGASMLRSDAALPFKDIVRNFDSFTQSVIQSIVMFNKKFNPDRAEAGDFNVIARGATSLIAKEVRGMQLDQLAVSMTPEEKLHVNERKMIEARMAVRDLQDMLVTQDEAARRIAQQQQTLQQQSEMQKSITEATVREMLSGAYKNITQGQKNIAATDAATVNTALDVLNTGLENDIKQQEAANPQPKPKSK